MMDIINRIKARTHAWRSEGSATPDVIDEALEFVAAIEAAMREPVAEVFEYGPHPWMKLHIAAHLLPGVDLPPGTKLFALPPDAAGEIAVLRDRLHGREVLIDKQQAEIERLKAEWGNCQDVVGKLLETQRGDAAEIGRLKSKLAETESQLREMSRLVIQTAELEAALAATNREGKG